MARRSHDEITARTPAPASRARLTASADGQDGC
jgi:hypothetical protein